MTHRRGVSLIELLLVMSAGTVMLGLTAALIHRLMQRHSKIQDIGDVERTTMLLAGQLRRDIHEASESTTDRSELAEGTVLRLQLAGDQVVLYEHSPGVVRRTLQGGDQVIGREQFALPSGIELSVSLEEGSPRLVSFTVTTELAKATDVRSHAIPANLQVSAVLGRDARFQAVMPGEDRP